MLVFTFFLLLLGLFEIISNLIHLSKKTTDEIGKSARRQHQEIPLSLANKHFFWKAIIMLVFGLLFLAAALLLLFKLPEMLPFTWFVTSAFGLYGMVQALIYHREIKVWPAMLVYNLPLIIYIFLS
ncbi:MAG TPA: hypothetical protein PLP19_09425 [bacterium]|nr:hypothetical protein [bacterium]HPN43697.1 hypothetical protein [bacterium]